MKLLRGLIFCIFDAFNEHLRKESKMENIEKKVDKLDKTTLAIGMFCSGFPVMMIGFSQMIDDILTTSHYQPTSFIYYLVGIGMVAYGMKAYYKRDKEMIIMLSITTAILITVVLYGVFGVKLTGFIEK